MTWLTVMEYLCHKWPRIVPLVVSTSRSFPHWRLITGFVTRLTRRVPLVEKELPTLPEHLSSPTVFSGVRVTRSLVLYVWFVDRCLSFCTFSLNHCVVSSSSIDGSCLPLWYLQTLLSCPTCLCFPKVDFTGNLFVIKVQYRRNKMFLVSKICMGRRRGRTENDHHRAFGMLEGGMTVDGAAVSFGVHRTTIWRLAQRFRITGTVKNRTISVDQNFSLLEKNVTSRSQQVVTASYQQQGLSTEYGEQLESVYPGKQSVITLKLVVSNQEDHIKVWS